MKCWMSLLITVLVWHCLPVPLPAQDIGPLITDRPDFTESPVSVARGVIQLEGGYTLAGVRGTWSHSLGEVLVRVGVGGPLELRFGVNSYQIEEGSPARRGMEDSAVGAKLKVVEAVGGRPTIGVIVGASLPTGGRAFRSETVEPEAVVAMSWALPGGWSAGSNVGFLLGASDAGEDNQWLGSVTVGREVGGGPLAVFAEAYGFAEAAGGFEVFVDGGVTMSLGEHMQLDMRVARQVHGLRRETHIGVGIARRWRLLP